MISQPHRPDTYIRLLIGIIAVAAIGVFILNVVIDPFKRNGLFDFGLPKSTISYRMNYPLYKIHEFEAAPKTTILLGDSRTDQLKAEWFAAAGIDDIYNFSYPSGTLKEAIETFWFASSRTKLEKVIIGLPFNLYSETNQKNRFTAAQDVAAGPIAYYFSSVVTKASINNILTELLGTEFKSEAPPMDKDGFWRFQLGTNTAMYYGRWRRPHRVLKELGELAAFCRRMGIDLLFYIPPTHMDLQNKVTAFGLDREYHRYKRDLVTIGDLVDFEFENAVTRDRERFNDPYHAKHVVLREIVPLLADPGTRPSILARFHAHDPAASK